MHRLRHRSEIRMRRQHQLGLASCGPHRRRRQPGFAALASREHKMAFAYGHAVQFARIVQREKTAIHAAAVSEFFHHCGNVPTGALHPAGGVEFGKEADEHALSLPSAVSERKKRSGEHAWPGTPDDMDCIWTGRACWRAASRAGSTVTMQQRNQVSEAVDVNVGGKRKPVVHAEAVVHDGDGHAGVSRRLHIHFRVSDEQSITRKDTELFEDFLHTCGVGFFC